MIHNIISYSFLWSVPPCQVSLSSIGSRVSTYNSSSTTTSSVILGQVVSELLIWCLTTICDRPHVWCKVRICLCNRKVCCHCEVPSSSSSTISRRITIINTSHL